MTISVNSQPQDLPDNSTVSAVLQVIGITALNGIAVAINNHILKKEEWSSHELKPQDIVVLIRASQGG